MKCGVGKMLPSPYWRGWAYARCRALQSERPMAEEGYNVLPRIVVPRWCISDTLFLKMDLKP